MFCVCSMCNTWCNVAAGETAGDRGRPSCRSALLYRRPLRKLSRCPHWTTLHTHALYHTLLTLVSDAVHTLFGFGGALPIAAPPDARARPPRPRARAREGRGKTHKSKRPMYRIVSYSIVFRSARPCERILVRPAL